MCSSDLEKLEMDVMNARKTKLGSDHPSTLTSMANLAATYRNQERWDEAEKLEMDVMNASKAKLEFNHPDIPSLKAARSGNEGKLNEAAEKLELNMINTTKVTPGSGHVDATLASITNQLPSNQDLQQDYNPPENMVN